MLMVMQISSFKAPAGLICIYISRAQWTVGQHCHSGVCTGAAHTHAHNDTMCWRIECLFSAICERLSLHIYQYTNTFAAMMSFMEDLKYVLNVIGLVHVTHRPSLCSSGLHSSYQTVVWSVTFHGNKTWIVEEKKSSLVTAIWSEL